MRYHNPILLVCIFVLLTPFTSTMMGCSRGSSTIIPDDTTYDTLPAISDAGQTGMGSDRQLQGIWETSLDLEDVENLIGKSVPIQTMRAADLHLNVRPFIATPKVYIRSWNPTTETLDLDVFIENTSIYNGYDLRLIIFRDTIGHKLLNPDNYTHLWDIPEGTWSNGFKAYAKENTNRILHAGEFKIENLQILCPGGNFSIKFAIDASWPSNCEEPYMMNNFTQGMLQAYQGATSDIAVDVYDWQDNVDSVRIQCSAITGQSDTYMTKISGTKWGVELVNNNAVPVGDYFALIAATSSGSIDPLIHIVNVTVSPEVGNGWARTWGGVGDDEGKDVAVDNDGNIYVTGEFENTVDFNPDPNEDAIITSNGLTDVFLVKYDEHGDFRWVKTWGAAGDDYGQALCIDAEGNVYCGSDFLDTVDFDPGEGVDSKTSHGAYDCSISKYTPDGVYVWTITFGGGHIDSVGSLLFSNEGYIYATGDFWSSNMDFDPGPGQDIRATHGYLDVYICKFDTDGNLEWARTWGGTEDDLGKGISEDSVGNIYCSGYFEKTVDFDPGPGEVIQEAPGSYPNAFLSSFDSDGNFRWVSTWGSTGNDQAWECAVDEFDDVYVVGSFYYTVDFDPDPVDIDERTAFYDSDGFICKYANSGDFQFVHTIGEAGPDKIKSIHLSDNSIFISGLASGDFDFGPGYYWGNGNFLARYDTDLTFQWVSAWHISVSLRASVNDTSNDGYVCGKFTTSNFDCDPGPGSYKVTPLGGWDTFLIKVLPNGLWE